jgi:hypothetical protein
LYTLRGFWKNLLRVPQSKTMRKSVSFKWCYETLKPSIWQL